MVLVRVLVLASVVLSSTLATRQISRHPMIFVADNFLSEEECEALLSIGDEAGYKPSLIGASDENGLFSHFSGGTVQQSSSIRIANSTFSLTDRELLAMSDPSKLTAFRAITKRMHTFARPVNVLRNTLGNPVCKRVPHAVRVS